MSITLIGQTRPLKAPKLHLKVRRKIDAISKFRAAGVKDAQIMAALQISQGCLSRILKLPEYQEHELAVETGVQTKMDELLASNVQAMRRYFAVGVPVAMQQVLDTIRNQKADLKTRLQAAEVILDRDPKRTFAKASAFGGVGVVGEALPEEILATRTREANALGQDLQRMKTETVQ